MAKRFTDTDKWKRQSFRELTPQAKLAFMYLCDQCDAAGIWPCDFPQMSFHLGFTVTEEKVIEWLGDKLVKFDGDKFFIAAFFDFQYGEAKEGFRARSAAIAKLQRLGLMDANLKIARVSPDSRGTIGGESPDTPSILEYSILDSSYKNESSKKSEEINPRVLVEIWNSDRGPFSAVEEFSEDRKKKAKAQLKKYSDLGHWRQVIARWKASNFCVNEWLPNFDDLLREGIRLKTLEGKYDNRPNRGPVGRHRPEPAPIRYAEFKPQEPTEPTKAGDPDAAARVRELLQKSLGYNPKKEGA